MLRVCWAVGRVFGSFSIVDTGAPDTGVIGSFHVHFLVENKTTEYEVQKGDTLSGIGKRFGVPWREIYEADRDQIRDPDWIQVGGN